MVSRFQLCLSVHTRKSRMLFICFWASIQSRFSSCFSIELNSKVCGVAGIFSKIWRASRKSFFANRTFSVWSSWLVGIPNLSANMTNNSRESGKPFFLKSLDTSGHFFTMNSYKFSRSALESISLERKCTNWVNCSSFQNLSSITFSAWISSANSWRALMISHSSRDFWDAILVSSLSSVSANCCKTGLEMLSTAFHFTSIASLSDWVAVNSFLETSFQISVGVWGWFISDIMVRKDTPSKNTLLSDFLQKTGYAFPAILEAMKALPTDHRPPYLGSW